MASVITSRDRQLAELADVIWDEQAAEVYRQEDAAAVATALSGFVSAFEQYGRVLAEGFSQMAKTLSVAGITTAAIEEYSRRMTEINDRPARIHTVELICTSVCPAHGIPGAEYAPVLDRDEPEDECDGGDRPDSW